MRWKKSIKTEFSPRSWAAKPGQRTYHHSAYWYFSHYGWTYSEETTLTGQYIDYVFSFESPKYEPLSSAMVRAHLFPFVVSALVAADIGIAMYQTAKLVLDPVRREEMKRELRRDLRIVRRPFYYLRENERRRALAEERRKLHRRRTTAPMPTAAELLEAWNKRKESKEDMIRLGGMLQDLECYVDNGLRFDEVGNIVGRNRGIRGWIDVNLPELSDKYKTLMRYKAMVIKLRQATETKDPTPTEKLLSEPQPKLVRELLQDFRTTFSSLEDAIDDLVKRERIFREKTPPKDTGGGLKSDHRADSRRPIVSV